MNKVQLKERATELADIEADWHTWSVSQECPKCGAASIIEFGGTREEAENLESELCEECDED